MQSLSIMGFERPDKGFRNTGHQDQSKPFLGDYQAPSMIEGRIKPYSQPTRAVEERQRSSDGFILKSLQRSFECHICLTITWKSLSGWTIMINDCFQCSAASAKTMGIIRMRSSQSCLRRCLRYKVQKSFVGWNNKNTINKLTSDMHWMKADCGYLLDKDPMPGFKWDFVYLTETRQWISDLRMIECQRLNMFEYQCKNG